MDRRPISFLVLCLLPLRQHDRKLFECLHSPDAAWPEHRYSSVPLPTLRVSHSVLLKYSTGDVALSSREMRSLRRADFVSLLPRRVSDRDGLLELLARFWTPIRRFGVNLLSNFGG